MPTIATIPREKFKIKNWRDYDASLRGRGSLTVWFTAEAIASWKAEPRTTRGGQPTYSGLAILVALTLQAVFRLALCQTEGLIGSVMGLLGLDLAVTRLLIGAQGGPLRNEATALKPERKLGSSGGFDRRRSGSRLLPGFHLHFRWVRSLRGGVRLGHLSTLSAVNPAENDTK